ncbi:MAG: CBS domain-containing protein [Candidatus Nanohaloarchaea archaeon]
MKSAFEITAGEMMEEDPETASSSESLSQIKNRMEEHDLRAIPVVNNGKLKGAVGYRDLVRHLQFNPEQTNVEEVMHQPPEFERDDSLVDLADLRINSGRKMLVLTDQEKLSGIISDREFRDTLEEVEEVQDVSSMNLSPQELVTVFEEDSFEKARHMMLDRNISRLPVLDENGNLTGIVRSTDMLKMMVPRDRQPPGGTSGRTLEDTKIAGGSEKDKISDIPVSEIMDRTPPTHEGHLDGGEAINEMVEKDSAELLIVDRRYPEGIVTVKDFIQYLDEMSFSDTVLVTLTGLELPEEKAALHEKIEKQLKGGLGRKLERPEELSVHIKKSETDGKKHRYEMILKLYSEYGLKSITEEGWDMLDTLDSALEELDEVIRREKEKREDHRRQA